MAYMQKLHHVACSMVTHAPQLYMTVSLTITDVCLQWRGAQGWSTVVELGRCCAPTAVTRHVLRVRSSYVSSLRLSDWILIAVYSLCGSGREPACLPAGLLEFAFDCVACRDLQQSPLHEVPSDTSLSSVPADIVRGGTGAWRPCVAQNVCCYVRPACGAGETLF